MARGADGDGDVYSYNIIINTAQLSLHGYIDVTVPFYDDKDEDEGLPDDDSYKSYLSIDGVKVLQFKSMTEPGNGQLEGDDYWVYTKLLDTSKTSYVAAEDSRNPSNKYFVTVGTSYVETRSTKVNSCSSVKVRIYPSPEVLKKANDSEISIGVHLKFSVNAVFTKYYEIDNSDTFRFNYPTAPVLSYNYSSTAGKYAVAFTARAGDDYVITSHDDKQHVSEASRITTEYDVTDEPRTVSLTYYNNLSEHQALDTYASITLPGYQMPHDFTARQRDDCDVDLSWSISSVDGTVAEGDEFVVQRSMSADFSNAVTVGSIDFSRSRTDYSLIDDISDNNINGTVYYRVRRTEPSVWGWNFTAKTSTVVTMVHRYVASAHAYIVNDTRARIEWEWDSGNVVSTGTQVELTRNNENKGTTVTLTVPADSVAQCHYEEELKTMCDVYSYTIAVKPGSGAYTSQAPLEVVSDEPLFASRMGRVTSFVVSKGYYSDHVELEWTTDGLPIAVFSLQAREYGTTGEFKQIALVDANEASTSYSYSDTKSIPGVTYEYKIVSTTTCGDENRSVAYGTNQIGFRTPTGNIYGRVTFDNGQAEAGVEVRAEPTDNTGITGKAYVFDGTSHLTVDSAAVLADASLVTLEAWIKADGTDGAIITKPGKYRMECRDGKLSLSTADAAVTSVASLADFTTSSPFVHVAATSDGANLKLYINGRAQETTSATTALPAAGDDTRVSIGDNFVGAIDEVRLWNVARSADDIAQDYNHYLVGNEQGLIAYYTFDYAVADKFYDISYTGSDTYNEHHGTVSGATLTDTYVPTADQLGYRSYTGADGSYMLRSIPYKGNGTTYMITPRLGIHTFEPVQELRFINNAAQSHIINFTDKSSFTVSGRVTYAGGTVPVRGVTFEIDGIAAMSEDNLPVYSDAAGEFSLSVPVGQHKVQAKLSGHTFANDGCITNPDGSNRNYQDMVTGLELTDSTRVRYIGRVAGGTVQEAYPVGHGLSTNNLADSVKVVLTYQDEAYTLCSVPSDTTYVRPKTTYLKNDATNTVAYSGNTITICPDATTGEFFADVCPIAYRVDVIAPGHTDEPIAGSGEQIDMSRNLTLRTDEYQYTDTINDDFGNMAVTVYNDTVQYHTLSKFIKRYPASIAVTEYKGSVAHNYFGRDSIMQTAIDPKYNCKVPLYDSKTNSYTLGRPAYCSGDSVIYKINVSEEYCYHDKSGNPKVDDSGRTITDRVPVARARLNFDGSDLSINDSINDKFTDAAGNATWKFCVNAPEFTSALRSVSIKVSTDSVGVSYIPWADNFKAVVTGSKSRGTDFVTKGPDDVLFVLRDPPGGNSYSFLEQDVTFEQTYGFGGALDLDFDFGGLRANGSKLVTYEGAPGAGKVTETYDFVDQSGNGFGINIKPSADGSFSYAATTKNRFETSSDTQYVGADGDLYVGLSSNVSVGPSDNVTAISKSLYDAAPSEYQLYSEISEPTDSVLLVKTESLSIRQSYETMFAYPQIYIEQTEIPNLINVRNSLLHDEGEATDTQFQSQADTSGKPVYVSLLKPTDKNYGCSNTDSIAFPDRDSSLGTFDGPSYKIYVPKDSTVCDTINAINKTIERWETIISNNERQKFEANLLRNISIQAGASFSNTRSYAAVSTGSYALDLSFGGALAKTIGGDLKQNGLHFAFKFNGKLSAYVDGRFDSDASQMMGFTIADSGSDYISVDVCEESGYWGDNTFIRYDQLNNADEIIPAYIFRLQGGATRCPYEDAYVSKYYNAGSTFGNATLQIEKPEISVEKDFIDNVPSGESAFLTLYLRNNSEAQKDVWYDLMIDDEANPYGAQFIVDGAPIGNGRALLVPAGETLVKTLEVKKGAAMDYDNLKLTLQSQCQCNPADFQPDIYDEVTFSVHFTPSATDVNIKAPTADWTYNTKMPTTDESGIAKHYMDVTLDSFDVNYQDFHRIMLQYKPASGSDNDWITLVSFYSDKDLYEEAIANGQSVAMIDGATATYRWYLDDYPDQRYDLRAVGTGMINNEEILKYSEVHSGIKDMYNPRLFGSAQPADGILDVNSEVRLNFNEPIAEGLLTANNFEVTGIRAGATTDHSVAVTLDGDNDEIASSFVRNWGGKSLTVELWAMADKAQDAVLWTQGDANSAIELAITADNHLRVTIDGTTVTSPDAFDYEQGNWAHIAMVYDAEAATVSAFYNYEALIMDMPVQSPKGQGAYAFGAAIDGKRHFAGKMHNARIWDKVLSSSRLQANSLASLTGAEPNLLAYYPMNEGRGTVIADKARGVNMELRGDWMVPEGRAIALDGAAEYVKIPSAATCVIDTSSDFTLELWFKSDESHKNAASLASNGRGDGNEYGGSYGLFDLSLDADGSLVFANNGTKVKASGSFADNDWHHVAVAVNRTTGRGNIYTDGVLNTYFEASDIGGIASDHIYLGARRWLDPYNQQQETVDSYFHGVIDEFRLWNLYKSEALVAAANGAKLDGTEKGLMAYYPFEAYSEWQGVQELGFSLVDAKVPDDDTIAPKKAEAVGGTVETDTSAPIKAKDAVSKLLYDFVVNDDALIINLQEPYDRIEKTTVTFTVDGVRDLNGNEILSPITWSAYIDRNQLKWAESQLTITKKLNEECQFTVRATNGGGALQYYTIENMPSWLGVEPASGTIAPASYVDVVFTIDPSLNIGTYDEVVYLRSDNNVVEALPITIKVQGDRPQWAVDPSQFKYNMSVFGKLKIDNVFSSDPDDMIAVFDCDRCVGVASNEYYSDVDMYYVMLTIYSNEVRSRNLEFRIWDAGTGATYIAEPDCDIDFVNDAVIGSPAQPVVFATCDTRVQSIPLERGWNWVSFAISNSKFNDLDVLLAPYPWQSDDQIKSEKSGTFANYSAASACWLGSLKAIHNDEMYLVHSPLDMTLELTGVPVKPMDMPLTILGTRADGTPRWSYISYLPECNLTLKEALAGYDAAEGDIIKSQSQMAMYADNLGWIGSLTYMESGKGYMLQRQSSADAELTYPAASTVGRRVKAKDVSALPTLDAVRRYESNMTAVVAVEGIDLAEGDVLAAYVGGELRGQAKATLLPDGRELLLLTISGDEMSPVDFVVERAGAPVATATAAVTYSAHANIGTIGEPLVIHFGDDATATWVYPSPFTEALHIRAMLTAGAQASVMVSTVSGTILAAWHDCCDADGAVDVLWSVPLGTPAGVYIVSIIATDAEPRHIKVIKK